MSPEEAANITTHLVAAQARVDDAEELAYYWEQHALTYAHQRDATAAALRILQGRMIPLA